MTSIVTSVATEEFKDSKILISGSRDKTIIIWKLNQDFEEEEPSEGTFGEPYIRLKGHNHFVSDLSMTLDS